MKKILVSAILLISSIVSVSAQLREGLTEYKLDNGLTVMLWEDHDQPDVTGYVVVRAGAVDEPAEYTGLAHYLEHMLFKGTTKRRAAHMAPRRNGLGAHPAHGDRLLRAHGT